MFVAAAVVALGILGINMLGGPTMVGKALKPIDGSLAVINTILQLVLAGAVYELWHSTQPAYGLVLASVLWGLCLLLTVVTISQIGKPRKTLTASDGVVLLLIGLATTGMTAYLVFA